MGTPHTLGGGETSELNLRAIVLAYPIQVSRTRGGGGAVGGVVADGGLDDGGLLRAPLLLLVRRLSPGPRGRVGMQGRGFCCSTFSLNRKQDQIFRNS